jgi:hypothetical protein
MYTVILTDVGEVKMPNSGVLASAIGPPEEEVVEPEVDEAAAAVADEQARPTQAPPTP